MRDIYEAPAAAILLTAHQELEKLVGTIHQNQFKPELDRKWAYLVYAGLWWEPLRTDLDAYMEAANAQVTGTIGLRLYKGGVRVVTRSSPNAVYDADLASFAESGGLFSQDGLARLHRALVAAVAARAPDPRTTGGGGVAMYNRLGRAAIRFSVAYLRRRYRRQIRIGAGLAAVAVGDRRLPRDPRRARGLSGLGASFVAAYGQLVSVR